MLSLTFVHTHIGRLVPVILAAMLLAGCSGKAPPVPPATLQGDASANADYYLQQLQQSSDDNKADWQLLAIRALTREGKLPQANEQLSSLPQQMSSGQSLERQLLVAELQLANKNRDTAGEALANLDSSLLSPTQLARFSQAEIAAYQGLASLTLLRAYIAQQPLLAAKEQQENLDQTWQTLLLFTPEKMNSLVINADENVLQGWLDLWRVYQENRQDPELLKAAIKDWQSRYPLNPAAQHLPNQLNQVLNFTQASTSHIALLLPINSQAKVFADAIQQGFEAAKNGVLLLAPLPATQAAVGAEQDPAATLNQAGAVSTSEAASEPAMVNTESSATPPLEPVTPPVVTGGQIKVYDSASQPLPALLAQAQQEGATLVVGPLLKDKVEQLASIPTTLNVLALNQPEQPQDSVNICYFALSPEDEARDAAEHIWQQQHRQPLLLLPRGPLGDRIAKAFTEQWQKQGGQGVLQQPIGSMGELRQMANRGGVRMTGTPVVMAPGEATTEMSLSPPLSANGNIDAVYIIATQDQLTLLKPMIDMTVNSRIKPAIFASSRSYQAGYGPDFRLEMEGLQFSEIPLLAGVNPQLQQQVSAKFGHDYSLVRLYAMGMDAWALANHFAQMQQISGFQLAGATGVLASSSHCVITRKLTWLQYQHGLVVPVP